MSGIEMMLMLLYNQAQLSSQIIDGNRDIFQNIMAPQKYINLNESCQ